MVRGVQGGCLAEVGGVFSGTAATEEQIKAIRTHERTGRPLDDEEFQRKLEKQLGRIPRRRKPGPKGVVM